MGFRGLSSSTMQHSPCPASGRLTRNWASHEGRRTCPGFPEVRLIPGVSHVVQAVQNRERGLALRIDPGEPGVRGTDGPHLLRGCSAETLSNDLHNGEGPSLWFTSSR